MVVGVNERECVCVCSFVEIVVYYLCVSLCVYVCVREGERDRDGCE